MCMVLPALPLILRGISSFCPRNTDNFRVTMQETRDGEASSLPEMFLAVDQWSSRFETTFFTIKMDSFEKLLATPSDTGAPILLPTGKTTFPAYYYKIVVSCGHNNHTILRRYSQFEWLASKIRLDSESDIAPELPPKSCFQPQDHKFALNRLELLRDYLGELLSRPGIATQPTVVAFLELHRFAK